MKLSGIYQIKSISNPTRFYIGSAKNISKRWKIHLFDLQNNRHHSKKLQRHFNKYGEADLIFSVLLGCDKEDLLKTEQYFLDSYSPYFNTCKIAGSPLGTKRGRPWNYGKKLSDEYRKKLSESHMGQNPWNKGLSGVYSEEYLNERHHKFPKGKSSWNKGKHYKNPKMIGNTNSKGRILTEEHKRKIGEANKRIQQLKKSA